MQTLIDKKNINCVQNPAQAVASDTAQIRASETPEVKLTDVIYAITYKLGKIENVVLNLRRRKSSQHGSNEPSEWTQR
jgi:hypothetical protein